jgi:hypothetical protein
MKASDGVMDGGGGRSLLPAVLNPLGELRMGPTIGNASLYLTHSQIITRDKCQL